MEHLQNVSEFHATLAIHTDWLNNAEKNLLSLKTPSKLLNTVTQQMEDFKVNIVKKIFICILLLKILV